MSKKIAYCSQHIPPEWIEAHGFEAVRVEPDFDNKYPIEESEGLCSFMRGFYNNAESVSPVAIISSSVCDQMRRGYDLYQEKSVTPLFLFNQPALWSRATHLKHYTMELKKMGNFLEHVGGKKPTKAKLKEKMIEWESKREALRIQQQGTGSTLLGKIGGPVPSAMKPLLSLFEEKGGSFCFDSTEYSAENAPERYDRREMAEDPLLHLSESWFSSNISIYKRPNTHFFQWLNNKITTHSPSAIVLFRWVWCDFWHGESQRISQSLDIPVLTIDLNENTALERNRTRIEAFMESLNREASPF